MLEIALVVIGLGIIGGSYVISEKVEARLGKDTDGAQVRDIWTDKDEKRVKERIDSILVESVEQAIDKTEYELSRISNEKILYSNEFSEQVLAKIEQNHEEVVFLYNMLSEKEKQMKSLMQEIETLKTTAEEMARKEEEALKAEAEKEAEAWETASKEKKAAAKPIPTQLKIGKEMSAVHMSTTDKKELSQLREFAQFIEEKQIEERKNPLFEWINVEEEEKSGFESIEEMSRNDKILALHRQGVSVLDISKKLNIGQGEVKLIIDLFRGAR